MLSIIIPTLNAEKSLAIVLVQVSALADEMIVSDGGSVDSTLTIALVAGARIASGCKGRGWQLARGAKWASGGQDDWLLFLHADTRLTDGWQEEIYRHTQNFPNRAGYFQYKLDDDGFWPRWIEAWVRLRCFVFALPYGDQGLLIRRNVYEDIGGFSDMVLFEDVDIVRKLGRGRLRSMKAAALTGAQRYAVHGYVRKGLGNVSLLIRYLLGADPDDLSKRYNT